LVLAGGISVTSKAVALPHFRHNKLPHPATDGKGKIAAWFIYAPASGELMNGKRYRSFAFNLFVAVIASSLAISAMPVNSVHALACAAIASGSWNAPATWSCAVVPGIGDTVTIGTPFTVTLTGPQSAMNVSITTGGTLALASFALTLESSSTGMTVNNGSILNAGIGIVNDNAAGGAPFTLAPGAILQTANTLGIVTGVALTGSIQTRGMRTYSAGADYVYNGTANQAVGNGLTQNTPRNLTINNPGNTVSLGVATTITGSLIMTAGTLSLAANTTVGDVQGPASITKTTVGAVTLTTGSNNASTTYSGTLSNGSGTVALTKLGTGALTLSGNNTYSGTTTLSAGTLNINSATAIGAGTFTITAGTINNTSGAAITLTNNNPQNWNGNFTFTGTNNLNLGAGAVTLNAARTVTVTANTLTVGGVIGGAFRLTKAGAGTLTLNAANTHSGTTLTAGRINIGNAQAFGNVASTVNLNGGSIDNTTGAALTTLNYPYSIGGNFTFVGTNNLNLGTGAVTLTGNRTVTVTANTLTVGGVIGGAFRLTKAGAGLLTLTAANTHSGTTLTAGTLNIGNAQALGNVASTINLNGGSIDNTTGAALTTLNYPYSIGGNITFVGTNNLNLGTGAVTLTGNRTVTVTANTLTVDGLIGGAFRLTKAGAGILTLTAANTHSGTTLTAGTLNIGNALAPGSAASAFIINGGSINNTSGGALTLANYPYTIGGNFTFVGTNNLNLGTGAVTLTGNRTVTVTANTLTVGGVIGGAFRLTKAGAGTLTLTGANTHSGTTLSAGTLNINNAQALGAAAGAFIITAGTIDNTSGAAITTLNYPQNWNGNFAFTGTNNLNLGTGAVTMNAARTVTVNANTLSVGGVIGGAFRLTKAGAGALTLSGANTFTGGATLAAGTLNINNAQALGTVAGTFIINGGTIDNTSGAAVTTLNYPQTWGGDFAFTGTNNLNLGTGAVTLSANRTVTVNGNTLTVGGVISPNTFDLTKAGPGILSFGTNTVNLRNLTISAGSLVSTSGTMNLAGNFTNNGTYTHNNGTVLFNGGASQSITGTTTFNNLSLNNANGLTINANETVNSVLTLTNGRIITGANTLIIGIGGSVAGSGAGRYVNGFMQKNFPVAAGQAFSFPIGDATNYTPVNIAGFTVTTTGGIIASTTAGEHPNIATSGIDPAKDVNRYWTLTPAGGLVITPPYSATFNFVPGDVDGGAATGNFIVNRYSSGWSAPAIGTRTATSTQATGIPAMGDFAIGEAGNVPPTITSDGGGASAALSVPENSTAVTTVTAFDPDVPPQTLTYSIAGGADSGSFTIGAATGILTFIVPPNYESPADVGLNNVYDVTVQVSDGNGGTDTQAIAITVTNVNEAPTDITLSNNILAENQPVNTVVGLLSATDPDASATFTYSLTCAVAGADDSSFNISGTNLRTSVSFDFETQSVYNICIRVTDQGGLIYDKNFLVNVTNINEAPINITLSNNTVNENQPVNTVVGTLSATDPDSGATFTFSLTCAAAGADDSSFNVSGMDLRTSASFDFETQSTYSICIRVTDQGGLTFDKDFIITVINVNEAPTNIALSSNTINENQPVNTVVGTFSATDPDAGATFTFSLTCAVAGADDPSFNISGTDLRASASFDYETQSAYNICIRVADQGGLTYDENFVVDVTNVNEAPTNITLSNNVIAENNAINAVIGALSATDVDSGETFNFSLSCAVAGADDVSFNINGANLRASSVFDYETKNSYSICIRVTDSGNNTFDKNFTITITDLDEIPPAVTIDQASGQVDPTNISPINFTVVFNETVSGFTGTDVTLSGTALPTTALVTEIAPNDGTTYNVAVSGMTSIGTVIASLNTGVATDAAGNGNTASTSTDNTVTFDAGFPVVLFNTDTTPANGSTLTPGPAQLTIAYNEDVKNDGSAGAANTLANYLLVEAGANGTFNTLSCVIGPVVDDTPVTIDSAVYTNNGGSGPFVATLTVNSGLPLPTGNYRLFICGTTSIEDLAGNELNNGLSDTTLTFSVAAPSVIPATGFPANKVTSLPLQPAELAYSNLDSTWLEIPALNVRSSIVGVPETKGGWDVSWLGNDIGWLNGTAFPSREGNSVLTAHVTNANGLAGPFANLKDLKYGDRIIVHLIGEKYVFEVRSSRLVSPSSTGFAFEDLDGYSYLTLITCQGYNYQNDFYRFRRILRAVLVDVQSEETR
jgi:LPXTG-site transpeptidase (sortase) family protein